MKNNSLFYIGLCLAILFTVWCFDYADALRGYSATGGEVFTIALPLYIVQKKVASLEQKNKRLEMQKKALQKHLS